MLAEIKGLPESTLRGFGLEDRPWGVLFPYRHPDGMPARSRRRVGVRGAGGSQWDPDGGRAITAYCDQEALRAAAELRYQILVEGESDCWVAWAHGFPAVGVPGDDNREAVTAAHLEGVNDLYVQVEHESDVTFPDGTATYVHELEKHVRAVGFTGSVHRLVHDSVSDVSELFAADPSSFRERLTDALQKAGGRPRLVWHTTPFGGATS